LNFCTGFAQGILQTNGQNSDGTKICLPNPAPKRSETMKEFATWVRADPSRRVQLASVGFLRFMAERFPCP
jgi:Rap1a immunity proteins